ncbi:MAG: hypothetical protein UHM08_08935 [Bacteroidales bacterium]|nr:hypothetical protein [Bacteroidales bacterium]
MSYQENRINRLQYEFGESNLNSKELVSPVYRSKIDKKYKEKQDIFIIDSVLNLLEPNVQKMIKKEVYQICNQFRLKDLCYNCKIEVIIAVIILYVWKNRHEKLREEQTGLWKKYNITYKKYALILRRLLQKTREENCLR